MSDEIRCSYCNTILFQRHICNFAPDGVSHVVIDRIPSPAIAAWRAIPAEDRQRVVAVLKSEAAFYQRPTIASDDSRAALFATAYRAAAALLEELGR